MIDNKDDFIAWFSNQLRPLYEERNAGLIILLVVFPLLERYVRNRSQIKSSDPLVCEVGKLELLRIFPELQRSEVAGHFWEIFRHGLLHQVTFFPEKKAKHPKLPIPLPASRITHDIPVVFAIEPDGSFTLHPALFAERILTIIESNFEIFVGNPLSSGPFPKTESHTVPYGMSEIYPNYYLGTNCSKKE